MQLIEFNNILFSITGKLLFISVCYATVLSMACILLSKQQLTTFNLTEKSIFKLISHKLTV